MTKYYVGIDPSLTGTAIVVIDHDGTIKECLRITTSYKEMERLLVIRNRVLDIITSYKPCLVGMEGYAFGAKQKREAMGELGGILKISMFEVGIKYIIVPPTTVKKFATGKGNAKKDHMLLAVYKKWGHEFKTNDEADAFVIASITKAIDTNENDLLVYENEALRKISV